MKIETKIILLPIVFCFGLFLLWTFLGWIFGEILLGIIVGIGFASFYGARFYFNF